MLSHTEEYKSQIGMFFSFVEFQGWWDTNITVSQNCLMMESQTLGMRQLMVDHPTLKPKYREGYLSPEARCLSVITNLRLGLRGSLNQVLSLCRSGVKHCSISVKSSGTFT